MKVHVVVGTVSTLQPPIVLGVLEDGPQLRERVQALCGDMPGETLTFELGAAPKMDIYQVSKQLSTDEISKVVTLLALMTSGREAAKLWAALLVTASPEFRIELGKEMARFRSAT